MKYTISISNPLFRNVSDDVEYMCQDVVFDSVKDAVDYLCHLDVLKCKDCRDRFGISGLKMNCDEYIKCYPEKAAEALGLIPVTRKKKKVPTITYKIKGKKIRLTPIN